MIQPGRYDIGADRWVACIRSLSFVGLDFTGATFLAHIRLHPDYPGFPLVALATVGSAASEGIHLAYSGTDTIANHIAAGRINEVPPGYTSASSVQISVVGLRVNETTMEMLPFPAELGDELVLAWDMHITPSGGIKDKYLGGAFTVRPGATQ